MCKFTLTIWIDSVFIVKVTAEDGLHINTIYHQIIFLTYNYLLQQYIYAVVYMYMSEKPQDFPQINPDHIRNLKQPLCDH